MLNFCEASTTLSLFREFPDKMHPDSRYSSNPPVSLHLLIKSTDCNNLINCKEYDGTNKYWNHTNHTEYNA